MNAEKPLKLATCTKCGSSFFFADPRPGLPWANRVEVHNAAPAATENREVIPFKCPRCTHPQFVEFYYGP